MSFVIYNKETTRYFWPKSFHGMSPKSYATQSAAKAALTREAKTGPEFNRDDYAIAESVEFHTNIEKTHMVRSSMNGAMVEESVNNPYGCSVASENYWCS